MKNIYILPTDKPSRLLYNSTTKKLDLYKMTVYSSQCKNIYITNSEEIKEGDWILNEKFKDIYKITSKIECNVFNTDKYSHIKKIILTTDPDLINDGVQAIDDEFLQWFVKNPSCEYVDTKKVANGAANHKLTYEYKIIIPKEETKQIYYNTVGRENGVNVVKGQFNTQKEALDLANELNRKFPNLYYDWNETLIKEKPKQEIETIEEVAERLYPTTIDSFTDSGIDLSERDRIIFTNGVKYQQEQDKNKYSEEEVKPLLQFIRNIKDDWDCDNDSHKYGTSCRCCDAEKTLEQFKKK